MILKKMSIGMRENIPCQKWDYYDNIVSVSKYCKDVADIPLLHCVFRNGEKTTFVISRGACLMTDEGVVFERFPATIEDAKQ